MLKYFWHLFVAFGLMFTSMILVVLTIINIEQFNTPYVFGVIMVHVVTMIYSMMIVFPVIATKKAGAHEQNGNVIAALNKQLAKSLAREGHMRATLFVNAVRAWPALSNEEIEKEIERICPRNDTTALDNVIKQSKMEVLNTFVAEGVISTDGEIYRRLAGELK